jgi:hypothetical protein
MIVVAALALLSVASPQAHPDFSGRWTMDPAPAAAVADPGSGWGSTITIVQNATRLIVEYPFFARGDLQPPLKFVYALDGSETTNGVMMGRGLQTQKCKAVWQAGGLVITTVHTFDNPDTGRPLPVEVVQTLTLGAPRSLVVETRRSGVLGGPPTITRTAYQTLKTRP